MANTLKDSWTVPIWFVFELSLFISTEIGSKISSFFGSSGEEENKESKVEVRELLLKVSLINSS